MSFDVEFEHDDEVQGIIELLGYPNSSVEEDMARLQGLWGSDLDTHLDIFLEVSSRLTLIELLDEYLRGCSATKLLEAHAEYYGTLIGVDCLHSIVMVLIEKLLIDDHDHDSMSIIEGLVRKGIPDGRTPLPQTVYDLTGDIAANFGSHVGRLVTRLTERFPPRKRLVIRSLLEMPDAYQRWKAWAAVAAD